MLLRFIVISEYFRSVRRRCHACTGQVARAFDIP